MLIVVALLSCENIYLDVSLVLFSELVDAHNFMY